MFIYIMPKNIPKLLGGGKIMGKHTTTTELVQHLIKELKKYPEVKKLIFGHITVRKSNMRFFRISTVTGGIRVKTYSPGAVQDLTIITNEPDALLSIISSVAPVKK